MGTLQMFPTDPAAAPLPTRAGLVLMLLLTHAWFIYQLSQARPKLDPPEVAPPVFVRFIELPPPEPLPQQVLAPVPPPVTPQPRPAPRPRPQKVAPTPPKLVTAFPPPVPAEPVPAAEPPPIAEPHAAEAVTEPPVPLPETRSEPPPVPPAPTGPREVSALAYVRKPQPEYPRVSRRMGEQGAVVIRVEVDEHGRARGAEITRSSGFPRLDQAALEAVRTALFSPHVENGRAHAARGLVTIEFKLEN